MDTLETLKLLNSAIDGNSRESDNNSVLALAGHMLGAKLAELVLGGEKSEGVREVDLEFTLEEAYRGGTVEVKLTRRRFLGTKEVLDAGTFTFKVPPGVEDGARYTFREEGNQHAPYERPEDVVFVVKTENGGYTRDGAHLIGTAKVSFDECMNGTTIHMTTLDNRTVKIQVPPMITSETIKVVEGEGMPIPGTNRKGNFILKFRPILTELERVAIKAVLARCS